MNYKKEYFELKKKEINNKKEKQFKNNLLFVAIIGGVVWVLTYIGTYSSYLIAIVVTLFGIIAFLWNIEYYIEKLLSKLELKELEKSR